MFQKMALKEVCYTFGWRINGESDKSDIAVNLHSIAMHTTPSLKSSHCHTHQRYRAINALALTIFASCLSPCLQVNEYTCGVGLAPHIDTHVAFEGIVLSLSVSGPCIMEFRRPLAAAAAAATAAQRSQDSPAAQNRYDSSAVQDGQGTSAARHGHDTSLTPALRAGADSPEAGTSPDTSAVQQVSEHKSERASVRGGVGEKERQANRGEEIQQCDGGTAGQTCSKLTSEGEERKPLFLPPKSLLVLSGEARYAWSHYIPNHKVSSGTQTADEVEATQGCPVATEVRELNDAVASIPHTTQTLNKDVIPTFPST